MSLRTLGCFFLLPALFLPAHLYAGEDTKPRPVRQWHGAYLVASNVGMSWIYAMAPDGTFKVYRPNAVDGNPYPCARTEWAQGCWCIASGRLYRSGHRIFAKSKNGMDREFYLDAKGKVCIAPNEQDDFPGQCEDEGRKEAMALLSAQGAVT